VKQSGKHGQVEVYSYDATPDIVSALKDGTITALLAQAPRLQAGKAVEILVDYVKQNRDGKTVEKAAEREIRVPTEILTKDNVDSPEAQGYLYKATCDA
jgi:ribose transport system substrate-binding protein